MLDGTHLKGNLYFIPRDIVFEKREYGNLSNYRYENDAGYVIDNSNIKKELSKIGWPLDLINEWITGFKIEKVHKLRRNYP